MIEVFKMDIRTENKISLKAWLEALGMKEIPDEKIMSEIRKVEQMIISAVSPKAIYRIMEPSELRLEGKSIKRHLSGCQKIVVMGATLGAGADHLIRRLQITDMTEAVIADCGASVLIEQVCDAFQKTINDAVDGYTTSRFSPGYGDFPIEVQPDMIRYIDGQRKIGLNVTSNNLLVPRKSVTAVIGVSDRPVRGSLATCAECVLRDKCDLRKEGKFCGD